MKCNQCNACMINGVFCHESGCPNQGKKWNPETQEFIKIYTCQECGQEYINEDSLDSCCQPEEEETPLYDVFIRSWWVYDDVKEYNYKTGGFKLVKKIVPGPGEKKYTHYGLTRAEALTMCKEYNDTHEPGELSIKAEFEES